MFILNIQHWDLEWDWKNLVRLWWNKLAVFLYFPAERWKRLSFKITEVTFKLCYRRKMTNYFPPLAGSGSGGITACSSDIRAFIQTLWTSEPDVSLWHLHVLRPSWFTITRLGSGFWTLPYLRVKPLSPSVCWLFSPHVTGTPWQPNRLALCFIHIFLWPNFLCFSQNEKTRHKGNFSQGLEPFHMRQIVQMEKGHKIVVM